MIIYTDMITNLMIFFLLCYCLTWLSKEEREIAAASFDKTFSGKDTVVEQMVQKQEEKVAEEKIKEEFDNVEINEEKIKITLPSPVLFDSGKAELKPQVITSLHEIAKVIKSMPNRIIVEGHTDNKPIKMKEFKSNWELSSARAFSVIRYFIDKENIDPKRLIALGYGEYRPKTDNDTPEHCAENRRIELNILRVK
ncbi:MAG: hypothetical protein A2252_10955 [Elusimicrobia bacterium RIFOXYA2_FULL_39_19]|nr:MAG: hypothetical protein A2252_10955 [Elusimicrobia bacterium RIFOXYA2_FULL_39_19]